MVGIAHVKVPNATSFLHGFWPLDLALHFPCGRGGPQSPASLKHMPETIDELAQSIAERVAAKVKSLLLGFSRRDIQPALLNVKDAAIYLGRTEQSIQHLIFQKELPVVRIGRRVHLDRRDLDA